MAPPISRHLLSLVVALLFVFGVGASAQAPRVYLRFDGNLADSSGAGVITSVTPSGFTPTYTTDRNGVASRALVFTGGRSLQLVSTSLIGNSNQALGLRNAAGTDTSFTLVAWVQFTSLGSGQGYSTVFGNLGSGAGTLHAGLDSGSDKAHFGFDGNDATGSTASIVPNVWYHVAFVYDTAAAGGPVQRIYVNGIPEITRAGVTNTVKAADLFLGNWGTATDAANDLKGNLDDVAVYNIALTSDRVLALASGVAPNALPAAGTYSGPKLAGFGGTNGAWGIREIRGYPTIPLTAPGGSTLVNADRIIRAYATTPGGTVAEYQTPVINMVDDEEPGDLGTFRMKQGSGPTRRDRMTICASWRKARCASWRRTITHLASWATRGRGCELSVRNG
jgi:Concanavalin A-like lectin/glucanases superfamily